MGRSCPFRVEILRKIPFWRGKVNGGYLDFLGGIAYFTFPLQFFCYTFERETFRFGHGVPFAEFRG